MPVNFTNSGGEPTANAVAQWSRNYAFDNRLVHFGFEGRENAAFELIGRLRRCDIDGTCDRVFTGKDRLRSAQYLNAFEVEKRRSPLLPTTIVNTIDVGSNGLFKCLIDARTDTPNKGIRADSGLRQGEIGDEELDILGFLHGRLGQCLSRYCGDRHRHILQALLAVGCGNNDLFEYPAGFLGQDAGGWKD